MPEQTESDDSVPFSWAGHTALERACTRDDPAIVRILLDHGADPNLRSDLVESALEAYLNRRILDGIECESAPIFALLLRSGADLGLVREYMLDRDGEQKFPAVFDRWNASKIDNSMSPIQIIGEHRYGCRRGCQCAIDGLPSGDGMICDYNCLLHR